MRQYVDISFIFNIEDQTWILKYILNQANGLSINYALVIAKEILREACGSNEVFWYWIEWTRRHIVWFNGTNLHFEYFENLLSILASWALCKVCYLCIMLLCQSRLSERAENNPVFCFVSWFNHDLNLNLNENKVPTCYVSYYQITGLFCKKNIIE